MDKILAALILSVIVTMLFNWYVDHITWLHFRALLIAAFVLAYATLTLPEGNALYLISGCGYVMLLFAGCLSTLFVTVKDFIRMLR